MIDYFKIGLFNRQFRKLILQNPLLSFEDRVKDGEIISQTATYKNMKVCVNDRQIIISGSLHKFWNPNGSNSNNFPMGALQLAIIELSHLFRFSPDDAIILGLEYGVNVVPDTSVSELISRTICYDCREPFESIKSIKGAGNGKEARLANYRIKIYDKGLQYDLPEPLLRFECKTNRSIDLKDTGARTLLDLTDSKVLQRLGQKLISRFECILFHEKLDETLMYPEEQLFYHDAGNPLLWKQMKRWKRNDVKRKYAKFLEKYEGGSLKSKLRKQIADKWEELQNCNDFAGFSEYIAEKKCNDFVGFAVAKPEKKGNVFAPFNESELTIPILEKCNDFTGSSENISEDKRNVFAPFNEAELTAAKLENSNDFALLKGKKVTSYWFPAEENPIQGPEGKSVIAEAEPFCGDLVKIVPDGRGRQQGNNNQLQIDWAGSDWPVDSDRLTGEVPTQKSIPPAEEIADQRQRRQPWKDMSKTDRSDRPVSNQLIIRHEKLIEGEEYPQDKENVIMLYLADEDAEDETDTNEILSTERRLGTVKKYKNNPSSALWPLLKKANQEKRKRYRSAGKIYNDFKMKKLLPGKRVK